MWKLLVAAAIVVHLAEAQRSSYAPRRGSNYKLLARYKKNETDSGLDTRGGQEQSGSTLTPTLPPELQGTLEDHQFVQRVSQWPEDRQPFWFRNRYAISNMRDRSIDGGNAKEQGPGQFQSPFQGSSRGRDRGAARLVGEDDYNDDLANDPFLLYLKKRFKL